MANKKPFHFNINFKLPRDNIRIGNEKQSITAEKTPALLQYLLEAFFMLFFRNHRTKTHTHNKM